MHSLRTAVALLLAAASLSAVAASSTVQVSATVAARIALTVQDAPGSVVVDAADIERGWVDVPAPLVVVLRSNLLQPMTLEFRSASPWAREVHAYSVSASTPLAAGARGVVVPPASGPVQMTVYLRMYVAPDAAPGRYPWPVRLSTSA